MRILLAHHADVISKLMFFTWAYFFLLSSSIYEYQISRILFLLHGTWEVAYVFKLKLQPNKVSGEYGTPLTTALYASPDRVDEDDCLECVKLLVKVWYPVLHPVYLIAWGNLVWKDIFCIYMSLFYICLSTGRCWCRMYKSWDSIGDSN
jgi:hypothetical protein